MGQHKLLLVQIGDAQRAVEQLIDILVFHQMEAPQVHLERVASGDSQSIIQRIGQSLNNHPILMLVLACDAETTPMLPALGCALVNRALWDPP